MTETRPTWADALTNVFVALKNQQPTPLGPLLKALASTSVSNEELAAFVHQADENESALTQARMALAKWDNQAEYVGQDGGTTLPRTQERRAAIYASLGFSDERGKDCLTCAFCTPKLAETEGMSAQKGVKK